MKILKYKFHQPKNPILIDNVDINKTVASSKVSFSKRDFKYFVGYKAKKIRPLCIFLPKMSAYRTDFDKNKFKSFFNEIWKKSHHHYQKRS